MNESIQADNSSLWLGLEGALESNDAVTNIEEVSSIDNPQVRINQSIVQLGVEELGHSEEVETLSIDAMEVDVQVRSNKES